MASYRQYRSSSNYRERERSRGEEASLDYSDPYFRWNASQAPGAGDFLRASDQVKYWNDYLRNSQMTWKDVKYPALLGGVSPVGAISRAVSSGVSIGILRKMYRSRCCFPMRAYARPKSFTKLFTRPSSAA